MKLFTVVQESETQDGRSEWAICEVINDQVYKRALLGPMSQDELVTLARETLGGGPVQESSQCIMGERVVYFTPATDGDIFNFEGGRAVPVQERGCLLTGALLAVSLFFVVIMALT